MTAPLLTVPLPAVHQRLGQRLERLDAAGEQGVADEGQAPAGQLGAGVGQGVRVGWGGRVWPGR